MNIATITGSVIALAFAASVGFGVIAVHEFSYATNHPFQYGPAKVIAWGAVCGVVLAIAVAALALCIQRATANDGGAR